MNSGHEHKVLAHNYNNLNITAAQTRKHIHTRARHRYR